MGRAAGSIALSCALAFALLLVTEGRLVRCARKVSCSHQETVPVPPENGNTKVLGTAEEVLKGPRPLVPGDRGDTVRSDLRWVPSGPDPLHHNGSPPKKPQTP